jgi:hypothetical protein
MATLASRGSRYPVVEDFTRREILGRYSKEDPVGLRGYTIVFIVPFGILLTATVRSVMRLGALAEQSALLTSDIEQLKRTLDGVAWQIERISGESVLRSVEAVSPRVPGRAESSDSSRPVDEVVEHLSTRVGNAEENRFDVEEQEEGRASLVGEMRENAERLTTERRWQEKKLPLDRVAKVLELRPSQREVLGEEILAHRQAALEIMRLPRDDGPPIIERIFDTYLNGGLEPSEKAEQIIRLLGAVYVPGSQETYLERLSDMNRGLMEVYKSELSEQQWQAFTELGVGVDNVKIENDPGDRAFMEYLAK